MKTTTEYILDYKKAPNEWETRNVRYLPILELEQVTLAMSYLSKKRKPDAYIAIYTPTNQAAKLRETAILTPGQFVDELVHAFGSIEGARLAIIERMHQMHIVK